MPLRWKDNSRSSGMRERSPSTIPRTTAASGGLDHPGDPLRRQVTGVIEAVLTGLGERDLTVHPYAVTDPDAREVPGEDLDAPTPHDLLVIVPQMFDPKVGAIAVA